MSKSIKQIENEINLAEDKIKKLKREKDTIKKGILKSKKLDAEKYKGFLCFLKNKNAKNWRIGIMTSVVCDFYDYDELIYKCNMDEYEQMKPFTEKDIVNYIFKSDK
jgi:hypothetical protein